MKTKAIKLFENHRSTWKWFLVFSLLLIAFALTESLLGLKNRTDLKYFALSSLLGLALLVHSYFLRVSFRMRAARRPVSESSVQSVSENEEQFATQAPMTLLKEQEPDFSELGIEPASVQRERMTSNWEGEIFCSNCQKDVRVKGQISLNGKFVAGSCPGCWNHIAGAVN